MTFLQESGTDNVTLVTELFPLFSNVLRCTVGVQGLILF